MKFVITTCHYRVENEDGSTSSVGAVNTNSAQTDNIEEYRKSVKKMLRERMDINGKTIKVFLSYTQTN